MLGFHDVVKHGLLGRTRVGSLMLPEVITYLGPTSYSPGEKVVETVIFAVRTNRILLHAQSQISIITSLESIQQTNPTAFDDLFQSSGLSQELCG